MSEVIDLPVVRAAAVAFLQHECWLMRLSGGVFGDGPHPFAGRGADSYAVAEVLFYGATRQAWWRAKMYAHGLESFMQLSWQEGHDLTLEWHLQSPLPTRSEVMRTVNMLKRAEKLGLVESNREYGKLYWRMPV